jgi:hypothetical protein
VEALEARTLLNNRFVVPAAMADNVTNFATLQAALTKQGFNPGDVIQIEQGSNPGNIVHTDIPAVQNLTIQGDAGTDLQLIPYFFLIDSVAIGAAQQGLTLKHLNFDTLGGNLQFTADSTITGCHIQNDFDGTAISLQGTSAAVISDSYIENTSPLNQFNTLVAVAPASGSHNRIMDNQFVAVSAATRSLASRSVWPTRTACSSRAWPPKLSCPGGPNHEHRDGLDSAAPDRQPPHAGEPGPAMRPGFGPGPP